MPHSTATDKFSLLYLKILLFLFFFFKDLSLVRVVCYARITYILRKLYIYIYNIYYMQFLSNDSNIFFAPPLFFILPFLQFHYLSWCVFHAIIKITFGMVISFLLFIPRYALNCSFLSTLSLERFASIKFLFFFFFQYLNFMILRLLAYTYLRCRWYYFELFFVTLLYNMIINLYRVINT